MKRLVASIVALSATCALFAEDEAEAGLEAGELPVVQTNEAPVRVFDTLPLCRRIEGRA